MATGSPSVSCDAAVAPSQRGELQRPAECHRKILGVATDAADLRGSTPTPKPKRRRRRRDQFQRGLGSLLQGKTMAVGIEVVSPDASWFLKTSVTSVFDFLHSICYVFGVLMSTAELFSVWFWCLLSTSLRISELAETPNAISYSSAIGSCELSPHGQARLGRWPVLTDGGGGKGGKKKNGGDAISSVQRVVRRWSTPSCPILL